MTQRAAGGHQGVLRVSFMTRQSVTYPHLHRLEIHPSSLTSCRSCSWVLSGCICQREGGGCLETDCIRNVQIWPHSPPVTHGEDLLPQVGIPFILELSVWQIPGVSAGFLWRQLDEP